MRNFVCLFILLSMALFSFAPQIVSAATYPAAFDWRDVGGNNFVTPPKNVGSCGSTWIFAPVAAVESKIMILHDDPSLQPDLSEMNIMSCGADDTPCEGGWYADAFNFMKNNGITSESCYPYDYAGSLACDGLCAEPSYSFIDTYTSIYNTSQTASEVKSLIYLNGPVVVSFEVYQDFYSYSSGVYQYITGAFAGLKSIVLVGWGNDGGPDYWIAKNDWGTSWGDEGFFKVAVGDATVVLDYVFYANDVDYDGDGNFTATDCDDSDDTIYPGAVELNDGVDNNCDGVVDEGFSSGGGGGGGCNVTGSAPGSYWPGLLAAAILYLLMMIRRRSNE